MLETLLAQGARMIPALAGEPVTYAGLRPATQLKDYQIEALPQRRWISAGGIRSTGLSAGAAAEWLGGIGLLGDMAQLDGFSGP